MTRVACCTVLIAALAAGGCSRRRSTEHAAETRAPEPPPPTPDTTPIAILRTPAGRVLGVEGTPVPATPSPRETALVPTAIAAETTTPSP
jgi:hypothetical protein